MRALHDSLRSLDHRQFELLTLDLLKARYPGLDIKHIKGDAGDQGVDIFLGQLDAKPTIWQCKTFANGIKEPQKNQIRSSLNQAVAHHAPQRWILCLNTDLDVKSTSWFQKLTRSKAHLTTIELLDASALVHQLLYQHTIREAYFPATILNTSLIRAELAGTGAFTTDDLARLTEQNAQDYLARLQAYDARFTYQVTFGRDKTALQQQPDAILTLTRGSTTLSVFPRDHEALRFSPPTFKLTLTKAGFDKLDESERTGSPYTLQAPTDIISLSTDFDFLRPTNQVQGLELSLGPRTAPHRLPLRVTFGTRNPVTYQYIEFKCVRAGTEETLFESATPLPFGLSILLTKNGKSNITFRSQTKGHDVLHVQRIMNAIAAAAQDGGIEFYNLAEERKFGTLIMSQNLPEWLTNAKALIDDVAFIATEYGVRLNAPEVITDDDLRMIHRLKQFLTGVRLKSKEFTIEFIKGLPLPEATLDAFTQRLRYRITSRTTEEFLVFGQSVPLGAVCYDVPDGTFAEAEKVVNFLRDAPVGERMTAILTTAKDITAHRATAQDLREDPPP